MNILRRLFRREKPQGATSHALAMVLLGDDAPFSGDAALDFLTTHWTDLPSVAGRETKDAVTVANIPGGVVGVVHVPMPVPSADLAGPVAVAWHWPEAAHTVAAHRAHVIVHAGSTTLSTIDLRLLLTKLAASVLSASNGVAVYVGDAMLVRSAADYQKDAANASRSELPILSWIGFNPVREGDQLSGHTTGLTAFGLRELEVRKRTMVPSEMFGMLADLANYQLVSGKVLRDGDTFGSSDADRTRIRYRSSAFIPEMAVAEVQLS
jgi:Domain of unknown function (DUF4261)